MIDPIRLMRGIGGGIGIAAAVLLGASLAQAQSQAPASQAALYNHIRTIDLPGAKGGVGGAMAFDADTGAVWLAQTPNRNVVVIGTRSNSVRHVVDGIERASGIGFSAHDAFVSDPETAMVAVFDKRSLEKRADLKPVGPKPGPVYYASSNDTLWVAGAGGALTIFQASGPDRFHHLGNLKLGIAPSERVPGVGIYVAARDRLYLPGLDGIAAIDPGLRAVDFTMRLDRAGWITSVAYDPKSGRLVAGTASKSVLFVKADTGTLIASLRLSGPVGQVALDPSLRRAFVANGAGEIDVIDLVHSKLFATLPAEAGVQALALDPRTHRLYVYRDRANKVDVLAPK